MKKGKEADSFHEFIFGQWGQFNSPAGKVSFLGTKARLGTTTTDPESRLTSFLRPVREILPTERMDFNELLQRDIDDHRVATELVPYLLDVQGRAPAFFPPIVAALLPFDGKTPVEHFHNHFAVAPAEDEYAYWAGYGYGSSFKFEHALTRLDYPNEPHITRLGRLSWNDEKAKLVILDGQHRAMALLAIYRTLNDEWDGNGEKYKHFYQSVVQRRLEQIGADFIEGIFNSLELPVSIVWFPSLDQGKNHQLAARKLFVDVNKNARAPSQSRVLLLSDERLSALLMRRLLNEFRSDSETLPIYAIEYDHPERDQSSSAKWSAVSNVTILQACVWRSTFGPAKYIDNLQVNFRGRDGVIEPAVFMRKSLQLAEKFPAVITADGNQYERNKISDSYFPIDCAKEFEEIFISSWGVITTSMLSDLVPYKIHGKALKELRLGWHGGDSVSRLAMDAIFEGVGMYWTIRDSYEHWKETNRLRRQEDDPLLPETDIVRAWKETEKKRDEFEHLRADMLLKKKNSDAIQISKDCYAIYSTQACQVGFVLAIRTLAAKHGIQVNEVSGFVEKLIESANAALQTVVKGGFPRVVFLSRKVPCQINFLRKLDSPLAVYFRYFWLEVLSVNESRSLLPHTLDTSILDNLVEDGRTHYYRYVLEDTKNALKRTNPDLSEKELSKEAQQTVEKLFRDGLGKWFSVSDKQFDDWYSKALGETGAFIQNVVTSVDEEPEDNDDSSYDYDALISPDDDDF